MNATVYTYVALHEGNALLNQDVLDTLGRRIMTEPLLLAKRHYYERPNLEAVIVEITKKGSMSVILIGKSNWTAPVGHHHNSRSMKRYAWNNSEAHGIFAQIPEGRKPDEVVSAEEYQVAHSSGCALIFRIEILH